MEDLKLIEELSNSFGPSGFENETLSIIRKQLEGLENHVVRDRLGSMVYHLKGLEENSPKVLLTAHADEVGFIVEKITPRGLIRFLPLGGWFDQTLLSQRVNILNNKGDYVQGMILSVPKHFLNDELKNKPVTMGRMLIDIGASSQAEVEDEFHIAPGSPIVPQSEFEQLSDHRFIGKALDDRLGCAVLIELLKEFSELPHQCDIYGAFTVQEEVGARGGITVSNMIKPDLAIILEAAPSDDIPGINDSPEQGVLGNGCQVRFFDPTLITNPKLASMAVKIAEDENIDYQAAVRRSGGTDGKFVHLNESGVPTIVLGVPARSVHSHNSIADINDYYSMKKLSINLVSQIDRDFLNSLLP